VHRDSIEAAVDEILKIGGKSWFGVHGSAVDPNDQALIQGHWVMPPEDVAKKVDHVYFEAKSQERRLSREGSQHSHDNTYEMTYQEMCGCDVGSDGMNGKVVPESRVMDVINMNPAWAMRFVPAWADFVAGLNMTGIHWESFGDFGHPRKSSGPANPFGEGAPEPDIAGFLRAAKVILAKKGLAQTMTFVDGYGFDTALLMEEKAKGRILHYPVWEAWSPESEENCFQTMNGYHFVLDQYPGYSKYHCCARNERQNAAEYGVWPYDVALKRQRKAKENGGRYRLIVDGHRFVQGPYIPDAVFLSDGEVKKLQAILFPDAQTPVHSAYIYGVSSDDRVVRQPLIEMSKHTAWTPISVPGVVSIAIHQSTIYGISSDGNIVMQRLSTMTENSHWGVFRKGDYKTLTINGNSLYCIDKEHRIMEMDLALGEDAQFVQVVRDRVDFVYLNGDDIWAGRSGNLVHKGVGLLHKAGRWEHVAKGFTSVAVFGDTIYAVTPDMHVMKQSLFTLGHTDVEWEKASRKGVSSIAFEVLLH